MARKFSQKIGSTAAVVYQSKEFIFVENPFREWNNACSCPSVRDPRWTFVEYFPRYVVINRKSYNVPQKLKLESSRRIGHGVSREVQVRVLECLGVICA